MTTVAQALPAVNLNWTVAESPAYAWGHEDATEGNDAQGSAFFVGAALAAYNDGYAAGLAVRKQLAPAEELDEIAFMEQALQTLRSGKVQPIAPLSAEQSEEISDEAIGEIFSTKPYLF